MDICWAKRIESESDIGTAKAQGFEAVEPSLSALMELDAKGLSSFRKSLEVSQLRCEVFTSILPADVVVTEQGFNIYSWTEYLRSALERAAKLGCRSLLWDEGKARILPVEGKTSILKEHFNQFLFLLCDIGEQNNIRTCLEPLGRRRTNFINSLPEVVEAIDSVNKPNLAIGISSSAISEIGITDEELSRFAGYIAHARLEKPLAIHGDARNNEYDCLSFLNTLKKIGYQGSIALPAGSDSDTLRECKQKWN